MSRGLSRLVGPALLAVLTIGVLVIGVFPTRTWLDQRQETAAAEAQLEQLQADNAAAQAQVDALQTDAEIERLARQQYGYARPGDEVYHVVPAPKDPVRVPEAWPFNGLGSTLER